MLCMYISTCGMYVFMYEIYYLCMYVYFMYVCMYVCMIPVSIQHIAIDLFHCPCLQVVDADKLALLFQGAPYTTMLTSGSGETDERCMYV